MRSRRSFLTLLGLLPAALAGPARAFEMHPYDGVAAEKAVRSGKPVVLHVFADWCVHCQAQARILDSLKSDPSYDGVTFFRVDYDKQKDAVDKLKTPRSTFIVYKGGKEVARMSWGTTRAAVVNVLKAAL